MTKPEKAVARKPVYDIAQIMAILPHRYPFLLIDRVNSLEQPAGVNRIGWKIHATKNVTFNEPFFQGHFPHRPVMPGVLQIEAIAQAACLAVVDPKKGIEMDVAIAGVTSARFRKPVVPGDTCEIFSEVVKDRGQILIVRGEIHIDGEVASEAEMIAKIFPRGTA